ncbi:hypothetical protein G6I58_002721 [Listeria monocytogenes]|nr:hypothetical protein [Listeria monocytogenes]EAE9815985.1 hypothetical protein [Listeria monocytogenes]EAF4600107.1 hypothetical protein [Listeria monocytogenes]EAG4531878.1 hypothetical protein [Listeria monocytogenes]EAG5470834.1 hypothetical protein [Listeria monocytogenes]
MVSERQKLINMIYQQLAPVKVHSRGYANTISEKMLNASITELNAILADVIAYQLDYDLKMQKHAPRRAGGRDYR